MSLLLLFGPAGVEAAPSVHGDVHIDDHLRFGLSIRDARQFDAVLDDLGLGGAGISDGGLFDVDLDDSAQGGADVSDSGS